ncbi:MAG: hypothetical protein IPM54_43035 [Polyangiaceae bacterium]|nr:hypothetical protein [Polyangiaceae bacterium]
MSKNLVSERQTLLDNARGTIVTDGPFVIVCHCPGGVFEPFVYLVSGMAIVLSMIIGAIVITRAAPRPIIFVAVIWIIGVIVANWILYRQRRKHGTMRIDTDRAEITQHGSGFSRMYPFAQITRISTPVVEGIEAREDERGFEHHWLLVELSGGHELRLGQGPMHELRPTLAFLRKANVPGMG